MLRYMANRSYDGEFMSERATVQEYQKALANALADIVMLKAQLADANAEIKDLKRPQGMSWEQATIGDL